MSIQTSVVSELWVSSPRTYQAEQPAILKPPLVATPQDRQFQCHQTEGFNTTKGVSPHRLRFRPRDPPGEGSPCSLLPVQPKATSTQKHWSAKSKGLAWAKKEQFFSTLGVAKERNLWIGHYSNCTKNPFTAQEYRTNTSPERRSLICMH